MSFFYRLRLWVFLFQGEVVFEIDPSAHSLTSFDIDLWSKWKIVNKIDGKPIGNDQIAYAPINLAHFTMWEEVIVQVGDKIAFLTNGKKKSFRHCFFCSRQLFQEIGPGTLTFTTCLTTERVPAILGWKNRFVSSKIPRVTLTI